MAKSSKKSGYFHSIPWCQSLLAEPEVTAFTPPSRDTTLNGHLHDKFFGTTLNHPKGIPHCLSFYKSKPDDSVINSVSTLFALSEGVNGYPNVAHGGLVAVLVDEVLGIMIQLNMDLENSHPVFRMNTVTATMDMKFLKPVTTPGVVLGIGWIKGIQGKKILLKAVIRDANGIDLASCESIWIAIEKTRL